MQFLKGEWHWFIEEVSRKLRVDRRRADALRRFARIDIFFALLSPFYSLLLYFFGSAEKIGVTRFELATSWSQTKRSSQAELHPVIELTTDARWRFAVENVS